MVQATLVVLLAAAQASNVPAQAEPLRAALEPTDPRPGEQEMADYLGLLRSIAPAAEAAARTYVAAMRLQCGRTIDVANLRSAMARGGGDAVLMGLIRAAASQDTAERNRLVTQMRCAPKDAP
jgi:hypothetical protein